MLKRNFKKIYRGLFLLTFVLHSALPALNTKMPNVINRTLA